MPGYCYSAKLGTPASQDWRQCEFAPDWTFPTAAAGPWPPGWPPATNSYLSGGQDASAATETTEMMGYESSGAAYSSKTAFSPKRDNQASAALGDDVLMAGGRTGTTPKTTTDSYDRETDAWANKTAMSSARANLHCGAICGYSKVVVSGGGTTGDFGSYNPGNPGV